MVLATQIVDTRTGIYIERRLATYRIRAILIDTLPSGNDDAGRCEQFPNPLTA